MSDACEDCRFWDRSREDEWTGFCRRYAPSQPTPAAHTGASVHFTDLWPVTARGSWCGEFQQNSEPRVVRTQRITVRPDMWDILSQPPENPPGSVSQ